MSGASGGFTGATVGGILYAATASTMATSPTLLSVGGGLGVGVAESASMKAPAASYAGATAVKVKGNAAGKIGSVIVESNNAAGSLEMFASDTLGVGLHTTKVVPFTITTGSVNRIQVMADGKVGINKAVPVAALDVVGSCLLDSVDIGMGKGTTVAIQQQNTAFGRLALNANTSGAGNTAIGTNALALNTTGSPNTAVGGLALAINTTGGKNTAIGYSALTKNITGSWSTAIGAYALAAANTADVNGANVAVGSNSLEKTTSGLYNTGVGNSAINANLIGSNNTALGYATLLKNTASNNLAVGYNALYNNTTGTENTAVGTSSLGVGTTASQNTAVGFKALAVSQGAANTAVGANALAKIGPGADNVAVGVNALTFTGGGHQNTAVGSHALSSISSTLSNTAVGYWALKVSSNGGSNTAVGASSMVASTVGNLNAAFGGNSMLVATSANANTAVGYGAMQALTTGAGNVCIGSMTATSTYSPVFNIIAENNRLVMGSSTITDAYVKVAWTVVSDARDKTNFAPIPHGLAFVKQLKPTAYQFRIERGSEETNGGVRYGFKAQDIAAIEPESVIVDATNPEKLYYNESNLIPVLVKAIQEQQTSIETLREEIEVLKKELYK